MALSCDPLPEYAELSCRSNFSFLRGASHPEELVHRAAHLGYAALALTDECSLSGIVRAHKAATETGLSLIVGTELRLDDGPNLILLARSLEGYRTLCRVVTHARRAGRKGHYRISSQDLLHPEWTGLPDCEVLWRIESTHADHEDSEDPHWAIWLCSNIDRDRLHLAVALTRMPEDSVLCERVLRLHAASGIPILACGDVHMHVRGRRALQDVLTALRHKCPVNEAAPVLFPNGERCLRTREELVRLYPAAWLSETLRVAEKCTFRLDEVRYRYPTDSIPPGERPGPWLRRLVQQGCEERWPDGVPGKVCAQIEHELGIIAELGYEPYFLTVHDIVRFARERGILCQGRGSAANSAVCYALGITAVDPARASMLFERFISRERNEPPDIDVDFEHERREEVIQYIYRTYGRERAALAAAVIRYRRRSALRDVGRALGISRARIDALTANMAWWDEGIPADRLREVGLDPEGPVARQWQKLAHLLVGFPRHLSQHTGGFVIAEGRLDELVPIENAAMPERTVIQWDKDDLDTLGLLKIDILALGMLSCLRRSLELLARHRGRHWGLADIPAEDPEVYAMLQRADSIGVFQIESRAQMTMLPRLRPKTFYDLVIEIAIVRPGPIQGQMVHPYLRRRQGHEAVTYPNPEVQRVLERTLGVPIFQEQVIELAMVAAGFSAGEADGLRRSIGAWRRTGNLETYRERLVQGMRQRGYPERFAEQIYQQILGFGEYGFPESHSASFALISYSSAWFKCHEPAIFVCALLNSQPMGFYAPAQIVADARRHGVTVLPVDVTASDRECSIEAASTCGAQTRMGVRLGLSMVIGLRTESAERIVAARACNPFRDVADLVSRGQLDRGEASHLARAGALSGLSGHRYRARWATQAIERPLPLLPTADRRMSATPMLASPGIAEDLAQDYAGTGLTLGPHPLSLLRSFHPELSNRPKAADLIAGGAKSRVRYIGMVTTRQRPGSAKGTVFLTLEDESGTLNVIVWPSLVDRARSAILRSRLLEVVGELQQEEGVTHLIAQHLLDRSTWLGALAIRSRDFG